MLTRATSGRPPCYELFFAPLESSLTPTDREMIHFAYQVSKYGHKGQVRDDGTRYFDHPKAAAWIYIDELGGRDVRTIVDLLLHDIPEDTHLMSPYRIHLNFGSDAALDLRALTKLPKGKETTPEYLGRVIGRGERAVLSKLCDRLSNVRSLKTNTAEKRRRQITETREFHIPLLLPALASFADPWCGYEIPLRTKLEDALTIAEAF